MLDRNHLDRLPGMDAVGSDGEDIGKIDEVYVDDATGEPSFALVNTGLFGLRSSFVPLDRADITGEKLEVMYTKDKIKDAPNMDPDGHLSPDEEDELYRYYGIDGPSTRQTTGTPGTTSGPGTVGRDTSGPETDDAMTRSEEDLRVGTREKEAGRARLRKHVVTDHVTETVPLQREEVSIEREPADGSRHGTNER